MLTDGHLKSRQELRAAITLHDSSLWALKNGGISPQMNNDHELPPISENVAPILGQVELLWEEFKNHAIKISNSKSEIDASGQSEHPEEIRQGLKFIESKANAMLAVNNNLVKALVKDNANNPFLDFTLVMLLVFNLSILAIGYILFKKYAVDTIGDLADISGHIAEGNSKKLRLSYRDPALKKISNSINHLSDIVNQSIHFADKIGNGEFDFEFDQQNGSNKLFGELDNMKHKLREISIEDEKRNWTTNGIAQFSEKLRKNQDDSRLMADTVLSDLVKYLNANQGAIYFVKSDHENNEYLELMSSYAWGRKKYLANTFRKGEGLIGQAWIEGDTIYLTQVPKNFVTITSGLGDANPNAMMIVPLKVNEVILGVLELATFNRFEKHQIEFVEKLGENIAATLASIRSSENTRKLLQESQRQTERLRSQEEEMRQNMEELTATQETMQRKEQELTSLLEASLNNVKQNLNEIVVRIESSIASGKKELQFLSHVPPIQGMIRALKNDGIDPMDNSTYDVWLDRFLVILHFLLDSKKLYGSVQFIGRDKQICKVLFANGITSEEREMFIANDNYLKQLGQVEQGEIFVFPPNKKENAFTICMSTPIYFEEEYFGSLIINLLGDEIIDTLASKEDGEYGYKLVSSQGDILFANEFYNKENDLSTQVIINKERGYSFNIINMLSGG